jgi:hypothetical protein
MDEACLLAGALSEGVYEDVNSNTFAAAAASPETTFGKAPLIIAIAILLLVLALYRSTYT